MTTRTRGQVAQPADTIALRATFYQNGVPADLASFPQISIIQPSGQVYFSYTGSGVYRVSAGVYGYDLVTGVNAPYGVWTDLWRGTRSADGYTDLKEYNFVVDYTQLPGGPYADGYLHLGDDVGFDYSQNEINNINKLLKQLRNRLRSARLHKGVDSNGNPTYSQCDIFTTATLVGFLAQALSEINSIPHFTFFTFNDDWFIDTFFSVLIQGASVWALASVALSERGREFTITDNGINLNIPSMSELLNTQYSTELSNFTEKVKYIKASMKPVGLGLGSLTITTSRNPAIARLRHLRERRII